MSADPKPSRPEAIQCLRTAALDEGVNPLGKAEF